MRLATEETDRSIEKAEMFVIWAHGQTFSDTPSVGDFYRPDELKYHAHHRGIAYVNFFGQYTQQSIFAMSIISLDVL